MTMEDSILSLLASGCTSIHLHMHKDGGCVQVATARESSSGWSVTANKKPGDLAETLSRRARDQAVVSEACAARPVAPNPSSQSYDELPDDVADLV